MQSRRPGGAEHDVWPLVVLVVDAIAGELDTHPEDLPPAVTDVLRRFAVTCHRRGMEYAHEASTDRFRTVRGFPPPPPGRPRS